MSLYLPGILANAGTMPQRMCCTCTLCTVLEFSCLAFFRFKIRAVKIRIGFFCCARPGRCAMPFVPVGTIPAAANRRGRAGVPKFDCLLNRTATGSISPAVMLLAGHCIQRLSTGVQLIHSCFSATLPTWNHNSQFGAFFLRLLISQQCAAFQFSHGCTPRSYLLRIGHHLGAVLHSGSLLQPMVKETNPNFGAFPAFMSFLIFGCSQ